MMLFGQNMKPVCLLKDCDTKVWLPKLLVPILLVPNLLWATSLPSDSAASTAIANLNSAAPAPVELRPFSTAEQEYQNEQARERGQQAKEVKPPEPSALTHPIVVEVDMQEAKNMLEMHLPLIVQQQMNANIDEQQIQFLVDDTPQDAKDMLDTLGYFNAQVNVSPHQKGYVVKVNLGERILIQSKILNLDGPILDDERLGEYYANAMENWTANEGQPFLQDAWSASKTGAISGIRRKQYPLAQMTQSQALITPAENKAQLSATIQSNQPIYFGKLELNINEIDADKEHISNNPEAYSTDIVKAARDGQTLKTNLKPRYPQSIVHDLAKFKQGDSYDSDKIIDLQNALEQNHHYSSVLVSPRFNRLSGEQGNQVPVSVVLQEVKRQKFDAGLNFDSEDGHGFRLGYEHYDVLNRGYVGTSFLAYNKYEQSFGIGLSHPPKAEGTYNTASLNYKNSTIQRVKTAAWNAGLWNVKEFDSGSRHLGLEFYYDDSHVENGPDFGVNYATMLTASWRYNRIETPTRPYNGYYAYGKVGATLGSVLSSASMQMLRAEAAYYYTPPEKKYGTWIVKARAGVVNVSDEMNAPQSLLFRTGGANSVRGYEHESIGIEGYHDAVMGGKILGTASLEYLYPIKEQYALAVFHDMGDVANSFDDFKFQHGTGLGARWFSPFAPIAFDLAYGHEDRKIRWYIGLGAQF